MIIKVLSKFKCHLRMRTFCSLFTTSSKISSGSVPHPCSCQVEQAKEINYCTFIISSESTDWIERGAHFCFVLETLTVNFAQHATFNNVASCHHIGFFCDKLSQIKVFLLAPLNTNFEPFSLSHTHTHAHTCTK